MGRRLIKKKVVGSVSMRVDPGFFNKLEDIRKRMESVQGRPLTQAKVTRALSNMMNTNIPVFKGGTNGVKKARQKGRRN